VNANMTPSMQANVGSTESSTTFQIGMQDKLTVLVISADLEGRRTVNRILEALSVNTIACSMVSEAQQVLSLQRPHLVFCDERLPDGSYADLLEWKHPGQIPPPIVVLTRTGEWELYMDAMREGAFDVIRSPWDPTDIELSLLRAARDEKHSFARIIR
jgi:DNA-binding NtrC family response regulator